MSDRQLNTLNWHRLRLDPSIALSQGLLYTYSYTVSLGSGGVDALRLLTTNRPIVMHSLRLSTDSTRGARFEFYFGGDVTGGADIIDYPLNHDQPTNPRPFDVAASGATVNTPGLQIGETVLDGEGYAATLGVGDVPLNVLAKSQDYYFLMTNLNNQVAELRVDFEAAVISERPPGL